VLDRGPAPGISLGVEQSAGHSLSAARPVSLGLHCTQGQYRLFRWKREIMQGVTFFLQITEKARRRNCCLACSGLSLAPGLGRRGYPIAGYHVLRPGARRLRAGPTHCPAPPADLYWPSGSPWPVCRHRHGQPAMSAHPGRCQSTRTPDSGGLRRTERNLMRYETTFLAMPHLQQDACGLSPYSPWLRCPGMRPPHMPGTQARDPSHGPQNGHHEGQRQHPKCHP
jgi:hypothetical protein